MNRYLQAASIIVVILFASCGEKAPPNDDTLREDIAIGDTVFLNSGVKYVFIKKSDSEDSVTRDKLITTHINLDANGNRVWSTYESQPFAFVLNRQPMITGFNEVIMLMREGDRIHAAIPSHLGYGPSGNGPTIPPNADLLFDIEVLEIAD